MRSTMRAFDPFDLSTFHCLDWRSQSGQGGGIMPDENSPLRLSADLVRARVSLRRAAEKQQLAKVRSEQLESNAHRLSAILDSLISTMASFVDRPIPEEKIRASEEAAEKFARGLAEARQAAVELATIDAEVDSLTKEADLALEALIASVTH